MARLILKANYHKPNAEKKVGGYAKYIATREGVDKVDESFKLAPSSLKQKKLIVDILRRMGETVKRAGSEYEWLDNGQKVTIKGNLWFHQYEQEGGDAVSFVQRYMDKNYVEAMEYLVGDAEGGTLKRSDPVPEKEAVPFELPPRNDNMRRVYAYLLTRRGLDKEVVDTFARYGMIYESADYHNAVFVGYDRTRKPMHVSFRGTGSESKFRGNVPSSTPEYSFHWHGKGLSPNSVNAIITVMQNSLKTAYALGYMNDYTADKIKRPKTGEKKVECFSSAEQKKMEPCSWLR